jgi:hypothetical protein
MENNFDRSQVTGDNASSGQNGGSGGENGHSVRDAATSHNTGFDSSKVLVTGTASLLQNDVEGGMVASKLRHVHVSCTPNVSSLNILYYRNDLTRLC